MIKEKHLIIILIIIVIVSAVLLFLKFVGFPSAKTERQLENPDLLIKDVKIGKGETVKLGDKLSVYWIGRHENGEEFDGSKDNPYKFVLNDKNVIKGWSVGLEGMKAGGKRILTIPSHLAYGETGARGMVGPNETLIYEIELLEIIKD